MFVCLFSKLLFGQVVFNKLTNHKFPLCVICLDGRHTVKCENL